MDFEDAGLSDGLDVIDGIRVVTRIGKEGVVRTLAPIAVRHGVEAALTAGGAAAAASVAYAGVGGTLLQAGVALGLCSTPLVVVAVPYVAVVGGFFAARAIRRHFR